MIRKKCHINQSNHEHEDTSKGLTRLLHGHKSKHDDT
jgi:hypothetical protein